MIFSPQRYEKFWNSGKNGDIFFRNYRKKSAKKYVKYLDI